MASSAPNAEQIAAKVTQFAESMVHTAGGDGRREAFVKGMVKKLSDEFPDCNNALCHPVHETKGEFVSRSHYELPEGMGSIGYDIYITKKGEPFSLTNKGDGGWMNWGYAGEFERNDMTIKAAEHG